MNGSTLPRSIVAVLVGNGAYAASQFAMLVVLARLTDSSEVGRYALALAVTAPLFLFAGLKLRQVQVTDVHGANTPGQFLALRSVMSTLAALASLGIAFGCGLPVVTVAAVAANKLAEGQLDSAFGTLQRHQQMACVARAQVARAVVGLVAFAGAVVVTRSAAAGVAALAVVTAAITVGVSASLRGQGHVVRVDYNGARLLRLALLTLPLGVSVALGSVLTAVPRYLLQHHEGAAAVGVFAALAYVLAVTGTLVQAVAESVSPRLADLYAGGELGVMTTMLRRLVAVGLTIGALGTLGCLLLGGPVLRVVLGSEYAAESRVLVVLMLGATLQYAALFVGTTIDAMRAFRLQAPLTAAGLVTSVVAGWPMVERWGLVGAAWSVVVTQAVLAVGHVVLFVTALRPRLAGTPHRAGARSSR